jgi:hypothetical protein
VSTFTHYCAVSTRMHQLRHLRPVTTYQARRPRSLLPWPYATFHGFRTHQAPAPRAVIMHCS